MPTSEEECRLLHRARGYTEAFHLLRILAGGLSGAAALRTAETRIRYPLACANCGAAAPDDVEHSVHCTAGRRLVQCVP